MDQTVKSKAASVCMRKSTESALVVTVATVLLLICRWKAIVESSTASVVITCRMTSRGLFWASLGHSRKQVVLRSWEWRQLGNAEAGLWCGALCVPSPDIPYRILAGTYVTYSLRFCPPEYAVKAKHILHHDGTSIFGAEGACQVDSPSWRCVVSPTVRLDAKPKNRLLRVFKISWSIVRLCFHFRHIIQGWRARSDGEHPGYQYKSPPRCSCDRIAHGQRVARLTSEGRDFDAGPGAAKGVEKASSRSDETGGICTTFRCS
jgi:hypothetical protein